MESSNPRTKNSSSTFHSIKTVSLKEWWLVKSEHEVEGKTLAVAGLQSSGQGPMRVFSSSTIIKRYDVFTLETADGVHIVFNGYINKPRTCRNGFSSKVFDDFLFGFPPNWEKYATGILGRACAITGNLERNSSFESCEKSPSKDVNIVSKVTPEPRNTQDEPDVTLEDDGNMTPENEDNTTHNVICKKSLNATIPSPQKECHLDVMPGPVSTSKYIDTEGIGPSSIGGKLRKSKVKSQKGKGNRGEILGSKSIVKDKIIEQNSAADSLKNANEKKLKKKSYAQSKKKSTKSESTSKDGTKKNIDFDKYSSPLSRGEKETSVVSPESMNLKRSRSGRILLPSLEFWRNQKANYDKHGQLTGIQDGLRSLKHGQITAIQDGQNVVEVPKVKVDGQLPRSHVRASQYGKF